jgi:long-chain acyl-CoA synthetase
MESRIWHKQYDPLVPTTLNYPRIPLQHLLRHAANTAPKVAATSFYGSQLTYMELNLRSLRMANALAGLGVAKGDRVALHLPNCPQYLIAYYAVLHLGAIVVNLSPLYTPAELEHALTLTEPKFVFTFDMVLEGVRKAVEQADQARLIVSKVTDYIDAVGVSSDEDLGLKQDERHFSELLDSCDKTRVPDVDIEPEDPAVIFFTGGTTGIPKGAVLTHGNCIASTLALCIWGERSMREIPVGERRNLAIIPLFHVYGQLCCLQHSVYFHSTMYLVPRFEIDEVFGVIQSVEDFSFFPAVPTLINALTSDPRAEEIGLAYKFKLINNGGGPIPTELIRKLNARDYVFSEGWGMTETCSMGITSPVMGLKKPGSIGIPLIDAQVKLVDVETGENEVPTGQPGEILIKAPYVMKEYWNNPEETANQLKDGWLHTGDVAVQDEDGYIFIVDRKKDMIIAGGYNIYPREIDEVLYTHPKVAEAISLGVPDEYRGETVKAFVVLAPGQAATEEEIIDFCREKLAAYKVPKRVEFRDELPKSAVGKILRRVLRDEEMAGKP